MARALMSLLGATAAVAAIALASAAAPAAAVEVLAGKGDSAKRCPAIDASDPKEPKGGCRIEVGGGEIRTVVRSIVGDMHFGDCVYGMDMLVDGTGRTFVLDVAAGGFVACNDIKACYQGDARPWRGRIEALGDGRFEHVMRACLDTCMGQFEGDLRLRLDRVGGSWRQVADRALVGDTGYQLDGEWRFERGDLSIRDDGLPASGSDQAVAPWQAGAPTFVWGWPPAA